HISGPCAAASLESLLRTTPLHCSPLETSVNARACRIVRRLLMRRTSFTKILVTFGLIALMPASANALVTTYKNLTCKAHGYNQSGDARWDLTIKNTGRM